MGLWSRITGAPDRDQFIADALARVRTTFPDAQYDPERFAIRGEGHNLFLDNFWHEYQSSPRAQRAAVIDRIGSASSELGGQQDIETYDQVRPRLRPMVHDQIYWSASRLKLRSLDIPPEKALPIFRPLGAHLTLSVVVDMPTSMRGVTAGDRATWERDLDALLADAMQNLERASRASWHAVRPGVLKSPFDDGYDIARLAMPDLFRTLPLQGAPVVLALNAGVVYVTGANDTAGLLALAELGEQVFELPKPASPIPLILEGDQWVPLSFSADHPARLAFDLLRYQHLHGQYEGQQEQLKSLVGEDGPFIATYRAMQKDGIPTSFATLTLGVPASLPQADRVVVMLPAARPEDYTVLANVPWNQFAEIVTLAPEPDLAPPRFFSNADLSEPEIASLRAANIE